MDLSHLSLLMNDMFCPSAMDSEDNWTRWTSCPGQQIRVIGSNSTKYTPFCQNSYIQRKAKKVDYTLLEKGQEFLSK
jgi:hypothetical protein